MLSVSHVRDSAFQRLSWSDMNDDFMSGTFAESVVFILYGSIGHCLLFLTSLLTFNFR